MIAAKTDDSKPRDALVSDPAAFARSLRLHYVSDSEPGGTRRRRGRGFSFLDNAGRPIRSRRERSRIEALAIPPAWQSVWICLDPVGHLQATGRDARNRKQYRYHTRWTEQANRAKFDRLICFGDRLPTLRRRVRSDLKRPGLDRRRVLATVARILDRGFLRLGGETYTSENATYGATTLRGHHVQVDDDRIEIAFIGKHHQERQIELSDPMLAEVLDELTQTRRSRLFRYRDGGCWHDVRAAMVNDYLASICGDGITAKWFRTWHGSRLMLEALSQASDAHDQPRKKHIDAAVRQVAGALGNKPSTARKFYIHPAVAERYLDQSLRCDDLPTGRGLRQSERHLLWLIGSAQ